MWQLRFITTPEHVAAHEQMLEACGAEAVICEAANPQDIKIESDTGPVGSWEQIAILAIFAGTQIQIDALVKDPRLASFNLDGVTALPEQDWVTQTQNREPLFIGERLLISPPGQHFDTEREIVYIHSAQSFGSGHHASTALALAWLERELPKHKRVIDYGCGTGILSIAALKLGAESVLAVDNDEQALISTQENALLNQIDTTRLVVQAAGAFQLDTPVDLIIANILAKTLIELLPRFKTCLRSNGILILSGLLREQAPLIQAAFSQDFAGFQQLHQDEWTSLCAYRI